MELLNKTFEYKQVLTSEELNAITGKVDEIAALLSSLDSGDSTITDAQILEKINTAKAELNRLLNEAIANVQQNIESLRSVVNGKTEVVTESQWAQYRAKVDETGNRLASMILLLEGEINIASLRLTVDDLNSLMSSLHIEPGKLELIAGLFDENDNLIINPASIIAAIVDNDGKLTSEITISANQVILDGDVALTNSLTGINANLQSLNTSTATIRGDLTALNTTVSGKATIAQLEAVDAKIDGKATISDLESTKASITEAVINSIEAGNVTITGDLKYNRLIGNVKEAIGETVLENGVYFVDIKQPTSNEEIVDITMPLDPIKGQVIYIMNMENARSIKANVPMGIYFITINQSGFPSLNTELVSANTPISPVDRKMGNLVTQFLFDGYKWIQLNAPFVSYNITEA